MGFEIDGEVCDIARTIWPGAHKLVALGGKKLYVNPFPDSKVHGANMRPIWGRQDPGGPHGGPMNFTIWVEALRPVDAYVRWIYRLHISRNFDMDRKVLE